MALQVEQPSLVEQPSQVEQPSLVELHKVVASQPVVEIRLHAMRPIAQADVARTEFADQHPQQIFAAFQDKRVRPVKRARHVFLVRALHAMDASMAMETVNQEPRCHFVALRAQLAKLVHRKCNAMPAHV